MIFAFIVSFFSFYHINVGGELYISELLFAGYLFFSVNKFRFLSEPLSRKIFLLGGLWLLSQIVTDLIRETPTENYLRGWAAIIFFLVDFFAMYIMVRQKPGLVRVLVLGSALGSIFSMWFFPTDYSESEPWKFGYGFPVTMLVLLFLSSGSTYKANSSVGILIALGMFSVYMNARSLGGIIILTAALLYLSHQRYFIIFMKRQNAIKMIALASIVMGFVIVIFYGYQLAAESGFLPENVTEKYRSQAISSGILDNLLSGRSEIFISSQAVIDSPIIGHGSWAEDIKYSQMQYDVLARLGKDESAYKFGIESSALIPVHSVIMQAWVWAGVLGFVFWLFILRVVVNNTFTSLTISYSLQSIVIFSGIYGIWNLLFSPFGAGERMYLAITLMIIYVGSMMIESNTTIRSNKPKRTAE